MRNRVGAIIIKNKKLLLVSTDGSWYWTPGGKVESGENEEMTLFRELNEELCVTPSNILHYNTYEVSAGEEIAGYTVKGGTEVNYIVTIDEDISPSAEVKIANWYSGPEAMKATILDSFKHNVIKKLIEDGLI